MLRTELDAIPSATVARGAGIGFAAATRSADDAAAEDGWQRCLGWLRGHGVA